MGYIYISNYIIQIHGIVNLYVIIENFWWKKSRIKLHDWVDSYMRISIPQPSHVYLGSEGRKLEFFGFQCAGNDMKIWNATNFRHFSRARAELFNFHARIAPSRELSSKSAMRMWLFRRFLCELGVREVPFPNWLEFSPIRTHCASLSFIRT